MTEISRAVGVTPQAVSQWAGGGLLPSYLHGLAMSRLASSWGDDRLASLGAARGKAVLPIAVPDGWLANGCHLDEMDRAYRAMARASWARQEGHPFEEQYFLQECRYWLNAWTLDVDK